MESALTDKVVFFCDADLDNYLPHMDIFKVLTEAFVALEHRQAVQPPQTLSIFPDQRGDFITYLGIFSTFDVFGAKLSPYIVDGPKSLVTAWTILMSMKTGKPLLLCDSARLTRERTAATTALAVDKLASPQASVLAIIGSGGQAHAHLRYVAGLREWREIRIFSPNLSSRPEKLELFENISQNVTFTAGPAQAAFEADVIMLTTSSGYPVIDFKDIPSKAIVTSISTNAPMAHEIEPDALAKMSVYCDFKDTTPDSAGEMVKAAAVGSWSKDLLLGDLPGLCASSAPSPVPGRPVFFRSIGLGLEDVAVAYALYLACQKGKDAASPE
jgi:L-arginine dehydrogenase